MFVGSEIAAQLIRSAGLVSSPSHPNLKKTLDKGRIEEPQAHRVQALACVLAKNYVVAKGGNLKVGLYMPVVRRLS